MTLHYFKLFKTFIDCKLSSCSYSSYPTITKPRVLLTSGQYCKTLQTNMTNILLSIRSPLSPNTVRVIKWRMGHATHPLQMITCIKLKLEDMKGTQTWFTWEKPYGWVLQNLVMVWGSELHLDITKYGQSQNQSATTGF